MDDLFGMRQTKTTHADGSVEVVERPQSWCKTCRNHSGEAPEQALNPAAIRAIRVALGISQKEMAERLGVARGMVSWWELGRSAPKPHQQTKLMELSQPASLNTTFPKSSEQQSDVGFTESARILLREHGEPIHYKELTDQAIARGLLVSRGKTPEISMHARLGANAKKPDPEFCRPRPGYWALTEWRRRSTTSGSSLPLVNPEGAVIDATATLHRGDPSSIVFESRGFNRNTGYNEGLDAVLQMLRDQRAVITLITLTPTDSAEDETELAIDGHPFPVPLRGIPDLGKLRRSIGAAQARTNRRPGAKGTGNATKRVRISFSKESVVPQTSATPASSSEHTWELLERLCSDLRWSNPAHGWPAEGELQGQLRTHLVSIYVRPLGTSGRQRPEERRFQNPGTKEKRPIHLAPNGETLLLGLWIEEGEDRAVVVVMDVTKRLGKETRFSMFVPVKTLQEAAESGFAQHENTNREVVSAVRVDRLADFVDQCVDAAPTTLANSELSLPFDRLHFAADAPPGTINIRPRVGMYAAFARLNYKPWFAISEFIDNAIQSFLTHRALLADTTLDVEVKIDEDQIIIIDRAAGIRMEDFPRAFSPSQPPPDNTGLSEFGLGMKAAACWFARRWSVRTTAVNDSVERTISFDVPQITRDGIEHLDLVERPADPRIHYTIITLDDLRVRPRGRTVSKIKDHLASIYRVLLADNTLALSFKTPSVPAEQLSFSAPLILKAPYFKTPMGKQVEWRREFHFEVAPNKEVHGWAALLRRGSVSQAGFSIFRRRRLIEGSIDRSYRPKEIFRNANSFTYQRLTGELHVTGFDVSHTKDGIQWGGLEELMVQKLKMELDGKALPLLKQAEGYRFRRRGADMQPGFGKQAIEAVATVLEAPSTAELLGEQSTQAPNDDAAEPIAPSVTSTSVTRRTLVVRVPTDHRPWSIDLELVSDPTKDWYELGSENKPKEQRVHAMVNLAHPFSEHFINDNEGVLPSLLRIVAGLVLAEHTARTSGVKQAGAVRRNLNNLLRGPLGAAEIEDVDDE